MRRSILKSKYIQMLVIALGILVSAMVMTQGVERNDDASITQESSLESMKNTIKEHKGLIVNSYLLGVSIFKEVDSSN